MNGNRLRYAAVALASCILPCVAGALRRGGTDRRAGPELQTDSAKHFILPADQGRDCPVHDSRGEAKQRHGLGRA